GIIKYKPSFDKFKNDVESCFQHLTILLSTTFEWQSLGEFKKLYKTGSTFQLPLQLALAISPIVARALGLNTPPLLQRINTAIWTKLFDIAQGKKTACDLLSELSQEFSEEELYPPSNPPSMLPASSAPLAIDPVPDSPVSQSPSPVLPGIIFQALFDDSLRDDGIIGDLHSNE
ncbi:hypothetical protein BT96DRAFT_952274, partial [Gymnopus androsaceus JB14]